MEIKVPLRISFIGGGTDFASWTQKGKQGHTLSCTFDRYAKVSNENLYPGVTNFDDLLKAGAKWLVTQGNFSEYAFPKLEVSCDMPPGSGLGTSSAIVVGMLTYLNLWFEHHYRERLFNIPDDLANAAIELERNVARISGGMQDQYISCFPGLTEFKYSGDHNVYPVPLKHYVTYEELSNHLILIDTGVIRRQSALMVLQIARNNSGANDEVLDNILKAVPIFIDAIKKQAWKDIGSILEYSWREKIKLSEGIEIPEVIEIEEILKFSPGFFGSKLMGAGGGGYILTICEDRDKLYPYLTSKGLRCILPNIVDEILVEGEIGE